MTEQETSHIEYWVMGFNHGINQERDRILELLNQLHDSFVDDYGHTTESVAVSNVITAIKKEN